MHGAQVYAHTNSRTPNGALTVHLTDSSETVSLPKPATGLTRTGRSCSARLCTNADLLYACASLVERTFLQALISSLTSSPHVVCTLVRACTMEPEETFRDLPSELWMNAHLQGVPALLSSCSRLCKQLHQAVSESSALQRRCAQECFAVTGCEPPARTGWREAFLHYCRLWRGRPALPARAGRFLSITPRRRPEP